MFPKTEAVMKDILISRRDRGHYKICENQKNYLSHRVTDYQQAMSPLLILKGDNLLATSSRDHSFLVIV